MNEEVLKLFERAGAYLRGHFLLTSGRHSDVYFEKFALLQQPEVMGELCRRLAAHFKIRQVETVLGPTLGGVIIAYELARQLECRAVYAESDGDRRVLKRGFKIEPGERVLLCDDILTTGRSVREIITLAEECEAEILGVGMLLDRSGGEITFDYPLYTLAQVKASAWEPSECPLCAEGVDLVQRGSRKMEPK